MRFVCDTRTWVVNYGVYNTSSGHAFVCCQTTQAIDSDMDAGALQNSLEGGVCCVLRY